MAAIGRLADEDAGQAVRQAKATAALPASVAEGSVDRPAAAGGPGIGHSAGSERGAGGDVAYASAAIATMYAGVAGLDAVRAAESAVTVFAEMRAALAAGSAFVARALAGGVERQTGRTVAV